MDKIYSAIFSQQDDLKRIAMVKIINSKLSTSSVEQLFSIYDLLFVKIASPANDVDLSLSISTLKVVVEILETRNQEVFLSKTKEAVRKMENLEVMWCMEHILESLSLDSRDDLVKFLRLELGIRKHLGDSLPAFLYSMKVVGSLKQKDTLSILLKWLVAERKFMNVVCKNRSFVEIRKAVEFLWDMDGESLMECLKTVFEMIMRAADGIAVCNLGLILMSERTLGLSEVAAIHIVTNYSEEEVADLMVKLSFMPVRNGVREWFRVLYESLKEEGKTKGLHQVTFGGALDNLVLQLFVPSCRQGALDILQLLMHGYQSEPSAFHLILPALDHLLKYMQDERVYQQSAKKCVHVDRPDAQATSLACVEFILKNASEPPEFDPLSEFCDLDLVREDECNIKERLALFIFDMMTIFSGFTQWYLPVMKKIKEFIPSSYVTDVKLLRLESWTTAGKRFGVKTGGNTWSSNEPRKPGVGAGLNNLGNTCYLNSLLQVLFRARIFRDSVFKEAQVQNRKVHREIATVFAGLALTKKKSFPPKSFLAVVPEHYQAGEQQDVSEFAKHLLDALEREVKHEEICGKSVTIVCCNVCGTKSETLEPFSDLSLLFPANLGSDEKLTLEKMIDFTLFRKEELKGENEFRCNNCVKMVEATLYSEILLAPTYLMVTLQRFKYLNGAKKIMTNVAFGEKMKIWLRSKEEVVYVLFGVIFHSGTSSFYGHYYCYATESQNAASNVAVWELCNDSEVRKASFADLVQMREFPLDTPYILFYRRIDEDSKQGDLLSVPEEFRKLVP